MSQDTLVYLWSLPAPRMAHETGSRFICDPPVTDTDDDYVVYGGPAAQLQLENDGYVRTSRSAGYDLSGFVAYRKDNVNVIFTQDRNFYHRFVKATRLAKKLNLTQKAQRVALFQAVLYDRFPQ